MTKSSKEALVLRLQSLYTEFMNISPTKKTAANTSFSINLPELKTLAPTLAAFADDPTQGSFTNQQAVIAAYEAYRKIVANISISQDLKTMQATADAISAAAQNLQNACMNANIITPNSTLAEIVAPEIKTFNIAIKKAQEQIYTAIQKQSPKTAFSFINIPPINTLIIKENSLSANALSAFELLQQAANTELAQLQTLYTEAASSFNQFNIKGIIKDGSDKEVDANINLLKSLTANTVNAYGLISSSKLEQKGYSLTLQSPDKSIYIFVSQYNDKYKTSIDLKVFTTAFGPNITTIITTCKQEHSIKKQAIFNLGRASIEALIAQMESTNDQRYKVSIAAARQSLKNLKTPPPSN